MTRLSLRYSTAVRITQQGIAHDLGISLITVSRALNDNGYVSESMKKKILEYAKEKHYVPHRASQVLVRNKTRRLALFSSTLPVYFWSDIRKGVELAGEAIRAFDFEVEYRSVSERDTEAYIGLIRSEVEAGLDALAVVNQPTVYDMAAVYEALRESGLPYITFNVDAPEHRGLCYVGPDYGAGARLAAEVIATALRFCVDPSVLVLANEDIRRAAPGIVNFNAERLAGFLAVMAERFPRVRCDVQYVGADLQADIRGDYLDILRRKRDEVNAVYLIPATNPPFLEALEEADYFDKVNVVHDLDPSALHQLDRHLVTAAIHQNPVLQGYYAVRILERIVETGTTEALEPIEIAHNVIYAENKDAIKNYFDILG